MRLLPGVLILLVLAMVPPASAQGPVVTSLAVSGAGSVQDLTDTPTKTVVIQVQFTARQSFTCTADTPITVEVTVTTTGPITATLDNKTLTYTIPQGQSPLQPYREDATTTLTVTKTGPHQEAEAIVTATYAGGTYSGCLPSEFAATNGSVPVRTTALAGGSPGGGNGTAPSITIVSPRAGAQGGQFDMVVSVSSFDLRPVPTSPGVVAGQGHIHYLVDGKPAEGDYATAAKNFTFKGLATGNRTLRAELVNNDHTSLSPPVFAEVKVQATSGGPATTTPATSTPSGTTPATTTPEGEGGEEHAENGLPAPGLLAVALAAVGAALVLRRR